MKFGIIGVSFWGNKGAAAMLESTLQTVGKAYPKAQFVLFSTYPKQDKARNVYKNLRIVSYKPLYLGLVVNPAALLYRLLPPLGNIIKKTVPAIRELADVDLVLEEGGITFSDGREIYLLFNMASILPALWTRTPVMKCAQALGPFRNLLNRAAAKMILPKMKLIVARGDYTLGNLVELGLKNAVAGADYAFALPMAGKSKRAIAKYLNLPIFQSREVVGIAPSAVINRKLEKVGTNYPALMGEFINWLIQTGYSVVIIPHSMKPGTDDAHNNDLPVCLKIYEQVQDKSACILVDQELTADSLRYLIGQVDMFVASRFHSMVSSLAMAVPTLVVGWSHKYAEVLKMFNMESYAYDYNNISLDKLRKAFLQLSKNRQVVKSELKQNAPKVKALSLKHIRYIQRLLASPLTNSGNGRNQ